MTIEYVNSLAGWCLVGSLIFGVASTGVIVFTDRIIKRKSASEISKANEEAEKAKVVAANTNKRAAILEKEAADARLETEILKQRLAWRRLTEQQFNTISSDLLKIKLKTKVILCTIMLDPEALTFATDIQHVLAKGNIAAEINQTLLPGQKPIMGIIIQGAVQAEIIKLATPFENAGFIVNTNIDTNATEIKFAIGVKPPAY